jgi:glutaredoxin-like protein
MEPLLNESIRDQVKAAFGPLKDAVHIIYFQKADNCDYCADTRQLLEEVSSLSDKITLEVRDLNADKELAERYKIDNAPAYAVTRKEGDEIIDYGIRYYGIPSGSEFSTLIYDVLLVSSGDSTLSKETREYLKTLEQPVSLMVFVTPT